jgi:hypothetical protein
LVLGFWARDLPGIGRNQDATFAASQVKTRKKYPAYTNVRYAANTLACVIFTVKVAN